MIQARDPRDVRLEALCLEFTERVRQELMAQPRGLPPLPDDDQE